MHGLPVGSVTFLFTDIEGSTRLLERLGGEYAEVLSEHRRLLREVFRRHDGAEVDTQGDAFFIAFGSAHKAVAAGSKAPAAPPPGAGPGSVGAHTGAPTLTRKRYVR